MSEFFVRFIKISRFRQILWKKKILETTKTNPHLILLKKSPKNQKNTPDNTFSSLGIFSQTSFRNIQHNISKHGMQFSLWTNLLWSGWLFKSSGVEAWDCKIVRLWCPGSFALLHYFSWPPTSVWSDRTFKLTKPNLPGRPFLHMSGGSIQRLNIF